MSRRCGEDKRSRALWGTARAQVNNLVVGVTKGFEKKLEISGVGYKAAVAGKNLQLSLGYSHDVIYPIPAGVTIVDAEADGNHGRRHRQAAGRPGRGGNSRLSAAPSPTRARASNTPANSSSARKGRRSKGQEPWPGRTIPRSAARRASAATIRRTRAAVRVFSVFRSSAQIYAQVIDDAKGVTLAAASSLEKTMREELKTGANIDAARRIGKEIAERAKKAGVDKVVFDRGGYMYHGRVKALAEGAREGGLDF